MSAPKSIALAAAFATFASVNAHGVISNVVANGKSYQGYLPSFAQNPPSSVVGWSIPEDEDYGFVLPDAYTNPDIICHKGATPAQTAVDVAAGGTVEVQWNTWPDTHHGPVIDYLANCNGECTTVDKTNLKFNKIDEAGLVSWDSSPGHWATDDLLAADKKWTVTIPQNIAPGNYVLRHELIGLHGAFQDNGAQNYPQCINLKITGSGTDALADGTVGTALYTPTDPGIKVGIYNKLDSYQIPGPKLYGGASSTSTGSTGSVMATPAVNATGNYSSPMTRRTRQRRTAVHVVRDSPSYTVRSRATEGTCITPGSID